MLFSDRVPVPHIRPKSRPTRRLVGGGGALLELAKVPSRPSLGGWVNEIFKVFLLGQCTLHNSIITILEKFGICSQRYEIISPVPRAERNIV